MTDGPDADTPTVVAELLRRLDVAAVLDQPDQLPHNRRLTPGVWRVRSTDGRPLVLKHLRADREPGETVWDRHWTAGGRQAWRWNYWAREPLAYEHRLTDAYAVAGISGPSCLGCWMDDQEAVLLLEWIDGQPGEDWPIHLYGPVAEALGRAQAEWSRSWPAAADPWLSRQFLRQYSSEKPVDWDLLDDDDAWRHPRVRRLFPRTLQRDVLFVHANRERLYRIAESLPQTLCHLDVWPKNLFHRPDGSFALIDWAFVGRGALGEDVGNLVPDACFDHFIRAEQLPDLERLVFDGYLCGVRAAGWSDDPNLIRLAMWASSVKYDWLAPLTLASAREPRHFRYGGGGEIDGDFVLRERSRALQFNAGWARKAIGLAERLGV